MTIVAILLIVAFQFMLHLRAVRSGRRMMEKDTFLLFDRTVQLERLLLTSSATLAATIKGVARLEDNHTETLSAIQQAGTVSQQHTSRLVSHLTALTARVDQGLLTQTPRDYSDLEIENIVRQACRHAGLNMLLVETTTDVARTGRLNDILAHTAEALGQRHPLRTVQDIVRLFSLLTADLHARHQ